MKAILYARSAPGDTSEALLTQAASCSRYAEQQGFEVVASIQDVGSAGRGDTLERPGLHKVRALAASGDIYALLVCGSDQIASLPDLREQFQQELAQHHVALHIIPTDCTRCIRLHLSDQDMQAIQQMAHQAGLTPAEWARRVVLQATRAPEAATPSQTVT
jgi:DNA invertase Pin-like site-specific DNA recombinase